jgi:hypothetical protein
MEGLKDFTSLLALIVSVLTLISTLIWRRDRVSGETLAALETRLKERLVGDTHRLEAQISASMAKSADNNAEIHKLRYDIMEKLSGVMTKAEMQTLLELVLAPVQAHMRRTESFIDESLRAGLRRFDEGSTRGHHNG